MKRALVILADGCEELEAVSIIDTLRRGGVEVFAASLSGNATVDGAHGVRIAADGPFDHSAAGTFDAIALPGGMGGMKRLRADDGVITALCEASERGALVCAVCAAPAVLDAAGLLASRRFCCYPGIEQTLSGTGQFVPDAPTVRDGTIVTGTGPGTAVQFALEILRALGLAKEAADVAAGMLVAGGAA